MKLFIGFLFAYVRKVLFLTFFYLCVKCVSNESPHAVCSFSIDVNDFVRSLSHVYIFSSKDSMMHVRLMKSSYIYDSDYDYVFVMLFPFYVFKIHHP